MRLAIFYILFVFFTLVTVSASDSRRDELPADNQLCQSFTTDSGIICIAPESGYSVKEVIGISIIRDIFHCVLFKKINPECINIPVFVTLNRDTSDTPIALGQRALVFLFYNSSDQEDHHSVN